MPSPFNDGLPRINSLKAKRKRGDKMTEAEQRKLEGYEAGRALKNKPYNRGAYVKIFTDGGVIEGTVVGSDDSGNYLIHYATNSECVIKKSTIVRSYLLRESTLVDLDLYVMGQERKYERIVRKDGKIVKYFDPHLEQKRIKGEEINLPATEQLRPGDTWGMWH